MFKVPTDAGPVSLQNNCPFACRNTRNYNNPGEIPSELSRENMEKSGKNKNFSKVREKSRNFEKKYGKILELFVKSNAIFP